MPRFSSIEVSVTSDKDHLHFEIPHDRHMQRQDQISSFIKGYEQLLNGYVDELLPTKIYQSLSDFPLLKITFEDLDKLVNETYSLIGSPPPTTCRTSDESMLEPKCRNGSAKDEFLQVVLRRPNAPINYISTELDDHNTFEFVIKQPALSFGMLHLTCQLTIYTSATNTIFVKLEHIADNQTLRGWLHASCPLPQKDIISEVI
ncbi:hypothetical protein V8C35DRAFT_280532 [Trichoderma chlorosporum]